jgi:hypothetical protein
MINLREIFSMHWFYSTDSTVAQSNHANFEGTIETFTQNFSQKEQLDVLWL